MFGEVRAAPRQLRGFGRLAAPALSLLLLIVIIGIWEFSVDRASARYIPSPSQIWEALVRGFQASLTSRAGWYLHIGATLYEAGFGLVIGGTFGLILGLILAEAPFIDRVLSPFVIGLQVLPKVAIAPLLVLLLGYDLPSKVAIVVLLTFFPLLINTIAGINSVPTERIEVMRSLAASRWQILWMAKLPSALPYIFAGLQMATVFSLTGAIVGEFVGGRDGLGRLIMEMNASFDQAGVFAVLVILACLGALFHGILRAVQRRVLFWSPENTRTIVGT